MYKNIVLKYIHLLTPEHIKDYAKVNNIDVSDKEVFIIYDFILKNYKELLDDNNTIYKLKPMIRDDLFDKVLVIYNDNKTKYII